LRKGEGQPLANNMAELGQRYQVVVAFRTA
jgi:hypothetical protein